MKLFKLTTFLLFGTFLLQSNSHAQELNEAPPSMKLSSLAKGDVITIATDREDSKSPVFSVDENGKIKTTRGSRCNLHLKKHKNEDAFQFKFENKNRELVLAGTPSTIFKYDEKTFSSLESAKKSVYKKLAPITERFDQYASIKIETTIPLIDSKGSISSIVCKSVVHMEYGVFYDNTSDDIDFLIENFNDLNGIEINKINSKNAKKPLLGEGGNKAQEYYKGHI